MKIAKVWSIVNLVLCIWIIYIIYTCTNSYNDIFYLKIMAILGCLQWGLESLRDLIKE